MGKPHLAPAWVLEGSDHLEGIVHWAELRPGVGGLVRGWTGRARGASISSCKGTWAFCP